MRIKINRKVLHCLIKEDSYAKLEKLCMKNNLTLTEAITLCINGRYLNEFKTDKIEFNSLSEELHIIQEQVNDKINIIEESTNEDEIEQLKKKRKERMSKYEFE